MTIVPKEITSWRELVCSRSLTTIKGVNWNIWIIWFGRLRHSAVPSVFNRVNTPISNFFRNLNFPFNRLGSNSGSKWYLEARPISGKWWAKRHRAFRFTTMARSSAFMKTRGSLETKGPSPQFKIMLLFLRIDSKLPAAKRSFQRSQKSKLRLCTKAKKIPKQSCECLFTATWVAIPTNQNSPSNKRPSSTKWTSVLHI